MGCECHGGVGRCQSPGFSRKSFKAVHRRLGVAVAAGGAASAVRGVLTTLKRLPGFRLKAGLWLPERHQPCQSTPGSHTYSGWASGGLRGRPSR